MIIKTDKKIYGFNLDTYFEFLIDKNKINIQIHKVIPKIDGEEKEELIQYMLAIYVPKEKTYYVKR